MHNKPKESDWKAFRAMTSTVRERYLVKVNESFVELLQSDGLDATERFWELEERVDKEKKILRDCLDHLSRSRMSILIASMYHHGMIDDPDLDVFSDELACSIKDNVKKAK